jgi:catechol 2,3-dioxygenase-like lactoylglutathione lyase family enzyme
MAGDRSLGAPKESRMNRFGRFQLHTTDVEAARAFYAHPDLLGAQLVVIWPLHVQALARGATPLGPAPPTREGGTALVLRDPGGAVLALSTPPPEPSAPQAVWCALNTHHMARSGLV